MDSPAPDIRTPWHPQAAVAAWVVPGLGHVMLGQRRRGVIIGVCIAFIWLTGLLVGGVSVLDREDHPMWFYGQMLMAPSVAVNYVVQNHLKINGMSPDDPYKAHRYQPSFGHVNEQGVLYTALAGLINLLAILDVIYKDPKRLAERIARDRAFKPRRAMP